jgi:hypothetical protein
MVCDMVRSVASVTVASPPPVESGAAHACVETIVRRS